MAEERYALEFWIEDEQYSVVERKDIIGEVEINKTLPVAWRAKKKGSVHVCQKLVRSNHIEILR